MRMLSKLVRQCHMYLALFLAPWVLLYGLSSLYMNHRDRPPNRPGEEPEAPHGALALEREIKLPPQIDSPRQVLAHAGLDGPHWAEPPKGGRIVIHRGEPGRPVLVTWDTANRTARIERESFHAGSFLMRLHKKTGYLSGYRTGNIWAAMVDLTAVAIAFWAASGIWLWLEIGPSRWWGAAVVLGGLALFAFFVVAA